MTADAERPLDAVRLDAIEQLADVVDGLDHEGDVVELLLAVLRRQVGEGMVIGFGKTRSSVPR